MVKVRGQRWAETTRTVGWCHGARRHGAATCHLCPQASAHPHLELGQGLQLGQSIEAPGSRQRVQVCPAVPETLPRHLYSRLAPVVSGAHISSVEASLIFERVSCLISMDWTMFDEGVMHNGTVHRAGPMTSPAVSADAWRQLLLWLGQLSLGGAALEAISINAVLESLTGLYLVEGIALMAGVHRLLLCVAPTHADQAVCKPVP